MDLIFLHGPLSRGTLSTARSGIEPADDSHQ
jgi:hypothetical protein